jgi:hypothetical protein
MRLASVMLAALLPLVACGDDDEEEFLCGPDNFDFDCASIDCHAVDTCDVECPDAVVCPAIDCVDALECAVDCSDGAICDIVDCRGAADCSADCSDGSICSIDCDGAGSCRADCSGDSPCLLFCGNAGFCDFDECSGGSGVVECPDGFLACNRDCPACGDGFCDLLFEDASTCPEDC